MKKKYKVHKSHFSVFMYVYISLRSVFGSASTGHNRQVSIHCEEQTVGSIACAPEKTDNIRIHLDE